jgi:hypothetical protein
LPAFFVHHAACSISVRRAASSIARAIIAAEDSGDAMTADMAAATRDRVSEDEASASAFAT